MNNDMDAQLGCLKMEQPPFSDSTESVSSPKRGGLEHSLFTTLSSG